jgi:hypothetical protein
VCASCVSQQQQRASPNWLHLQAASACRSPTSAILRFNARPGFIHVPVKRHRGLSGYVSHGNTETGKKTPGEPGHTRDTQDTRAQMGTRITQTNLTTIQTQRHTRTSARPRDGQVNSRKNGRRPGPDRYRSRRKTSRHPDVFSWGGHSLGASRFWGAGRRASFGSLVFQVVFAIGELVSNKLLRDPRSILVGEW